MHSISRINARGQNQHGDASVDYLTNTEGLSPELEAARDRAIEAKRELAALDGAVSYYHDESEGDTQRWSGKLAAELGLAGKKVDKEALLALARGFHPQTGEPLCQNAGEAPREVAKVDRNGKPKLDKQGNPIIKMEGGHRVGFDITVTPPKSVSIAFAIAEGDEKYAILEAHRKANATSMAYLESMVETRRGKAGRDVIGTEGLVIMQADHVGNRNLEMNVHTHNLVLGVSKGTDGKWGTFDAQELYRHRMTADQIYKNELAMNLRELGYGIEQERILDADGNETGMVSFEVAGIDRELIETFSTRRQEILDYEAAHGVDRQAACLATRKHKDEPSPEEMDRMWKDTMAAINENRPGWIPTLEQLKLEKDRDMRMDDNAVILERLHENEAVVCEHDLVNRLGQEHMGKVRFPELMAKVEEFKLATGMVEIHAEKLAEEDRGASLSRKHTETRFSAPWMVEWEKEVVHRVASRANEDHQKLEPAKVESAIEAYEQRKGFTLSGEQREAVEHITMKSGGVALLSGMAGTGKTTVSDAYSEAFKADGRNMLGVCVSNAAARKLESESGMPCRSVAKMLSLLDRDRMKFTERDVLVVDEAGMIDTDQTRRLLTHAQQGGAKVILQGDVMQLQPIGAGSGMSLAKLAVDDAQLTEVWRQEHVEDRAIVGMHYERDKEGKMKNLVKGTRSRAKTLAMGTEIMEALQARDCIDVYDHMEQAMDGLVDDYMKSTVVMEEKLVLASSRVEVSVLSNKIRDALKADGLLPADEVGFKAKDNGKEAMLQIARGDRVRFTKSDMDKLGVANGDGGVVERIRTGEEGGFDLTVRMMSSDSQMDGRLVQFNTNEWNYLQHNYAGTIHKSQGQGKEEVFHLANMGMMDNHSSLVAMSRLTKGRYRLYGDDETIERLEERFALERLKGNAITEGVKGQEQEPLSIVERVVQAQIERGEHEEKVERNSALTEKDRKDLRELTLTIPRTPDRELERERELQRPNRSRGLTR